MDSEMIIPSQERKSGYHVPSLTCGIPSMTRGPAARAVTDSQPRRGGRVAAEGWTDSQTRLTDVFLLEEHTDPQPRRGGRVAAEGTGVRRHDGGRVAAEGQTQTRRREGRMCSC